VSVSGRCLHREVEAVPFSTLTLTVIHFDHTERGILTTPVYRLPRSPLHTDDHSRSHPCPDSASIFETVLLPKDGYAPLVIQRSHRAFETDYSAPAPSVTLASDRAVQQLAPLRHPINLVFASLLGHMPCLPQSPDHPLSQAIRL
jgi:hypothetical protein